VGDRFKDEKEGRLGMLDRCYFCKAKVVEQEITIDYRWGEDTLVVIKDVPAGVYQQCGEKYLSSNIYKELEKVAKNKSHLMGKMTVDILTFEASSAQ
jgi:YgiT-type zinc finger domain-containing protein